MSEAFDINLAKIDQIEKNQLDIEIDTVILNIQLVKKVND